MITILQGDCLERLRELPDESIQCCVTSPPYWNLRDYGVAGQLGLDKTPEEYVAKMVEVFAEVRRVLRDDGTLWLNLGDSYAGNGKASQATEADTRHATVGALLSLAQRRQGAVDGLKPKDLVGIPWRVAFALQQPYYTGRIKRAEDRIWLAAMLEAEGCLFIHKRKAGQNAGNGYTRQSDTYSPGLEIANTNEGIIRRCIEIAGVGSICSQSPEQNGRRKQTIFRWNLRTTESRDLVRELYPHIVAKRQQARIFCGCPTSGREAGAAHAALKLLHNGHETTVDFKDPATMFEPGWYLRSDVIWSKPNPMPESVTDRPTKSHEYIFLLTKSPTYFYDADAIKEAAVAGDNGSSFTSEYDFATKPNLGTKPRVPCVSSHMAGTQRNDGDRWRNDEGGVAARGTRNKRTVWTVATSPYSEAHFATFPPDLIKPCILAGTSAKGCCPKCGAPWERITKTTKPPLRKVNGTGPHADHGLLGGHRFDGPTKTETIGWQPTCTCGREQVQPCTVLDPFGGSGTTGMVAIELGRKAVLIELNPDYVRLIEQRTFVTPGLALT